MEIPYAERDRFSLPVVCGKILKAFLVQQNIPFSKTHDLLELHKLCLTVDPAFDFIADLLDQLNPYAVAFRYPGEDISIEEARAAVHSMKEVRRFIRGFLK